MSTATVGIPADLVPDDHHVCVFQVVGDSMTPGIRDGDLVIVDADLQARDGDVAAVWINNWNGVSGRVVKRLSHGGTVLKSTNPKYPPMVLGPEHRPRVEGVVVGVMRVPR